MAGPGNLPYWRGSNTAKCRNELRKELRKGTWSCRRLPSIMRFVRAPRRRTLLTALVVASMSLSMVEVMVADVHDGDATEAELSSLSPFEAQSPSTVPVAANSERGEDPSQPEHTRHVCHCIHAHGVMVTTALFTPVRPQTAFETAFGTVKVFKTTTLAGPPTPPPIA
jgi:hypothetical protein